jgi:hypothetical protein
MRHEVREKRANPGLWTAVTLSPHLKQNSSSMNISVYKHCPMRLTAFLAVAWNALLHSSKLRGYTKCVPRTWQLRLQTWV